MNVPNFMTKVHAVPSVMKYLSGGLTEAIIRAMQLAWLKTKYKVCEISAYLEIDGLL